MSNYWNFLNKMEKKMSLINLSWSSRALKALIMSEQTAEERLTKGEAFDSLDMILNHYRFPTKSSSIELLNKF